MKSISLHEAYNLLQQCRAVDIEGRIVEPILFECEEEDQNEFLILRWEEMYKDEELIVEVIFEEGDNRMVEVDRRKLYLVSSDGAQEELILLKEMDLEKN